MVLVLVLVLALVVRRRTCSTYLTEGLLWTLGISVHLEALLPSVCLESNSSFSSSYSFNSDCEKTTRKVRSKGDNVSLGPKQPHFLTDLNEPPHPALTVAFTFKAISKTLQKMPEWHLMHFKETLWKHYPQSFTASPKSMDLVDLVDRLLECYNLQGSLQLVKALLEEMGQDEVRFELRRSLKSKYGDVSEDFGTPLLSQRRFRSPARSPAEERDFLVNMGKMAWCMLEEGHVKISRAHWQVAGGVAVDEAVVNSGLCTEFTVNQFVMFNENVHCFIHSTLQEYMAALYVFLVFWNQGRTVLKEPSKRKQPKDFTRNKEVLGVYMN
ncbi:hypothetical protein CRUP_037582 [Coryphaenoides rupestris]|nr:hypothetical protein CRUP_037582 [Coryphaenoides rupestris]